MPRALVLRHVAFEDLGLFEGPLRQRGYTIETVDAGVDAHPRRLRSADLLIVCGGPIGAYETDRYPYLSEEINAIGERIGIGAPTLGLCLGAQLMAAAMGAPVYPGRHKELGWSPLQLTEAGCASPLAAVGDLPVLHWHGDTFDIPKGATWLAASADTPHQAFSVGHHALALQFHLEMDPSRIEQWLIGHTAELTAAGINLPALRAATALHGPQLAAIARSVLTTWLDTLTARRPG
ncbi:glutamine amidotransferase [Zoogloeaceae bacterium G21618-S1]|nr:glutamine amidotransferase [Zoogloeaceae bacterium G21618-S1]